MKKFLLSLATILCGVSAWAAVLPTQDLKASANLPLGTPEFQFYIRQAQNNGKYWTATTTATSNKNEAGKFAFYAVPGVADCYYIYNIDQDKWLNYSTASGSNQRDYASLADNFNANAYWKITKNTLKDNPTVICYQMQPTTYEVGNVNIRDKYANWYQGANSTNTIGLWEKDAANDTGSGWSLEPIAEDNTILMAKEIAFAKNVLETKGYSYTKGTNIVTTVNVTTILSSPYTETKQGQGSIAELVDGDAATFWHSRWSNDDGLGGNKINGSHFLVADVSSIYTGENTVPELLSFKYTRRSGANADKTTRWAVYGVPTAGGTTIADDSREGLTLLAVVYTPTTANEFENIFPTKGFKKFRFYCEATSNNRGYFHIGEFQLNPMTAAESNTAEMKALASALATAEAVTSPTEDDINALKAETDKYKADESALTEAQNLLNMTGVGYPSATATARVNLYNALNGSGVTSEELTTLVAAYKSSTEIALPEDGHAYSFSFVDMNGAEYKIGASGTTLSGNAEEAATFYCRKYTNVDGQERYAFISAEGNFLGYKTLNTNYRTHVNADKRLQSDFIVATMLGITSNVAANTEEARFGTVYLKVNNRTLANQDKAGAFILKLANKQFDMSDVPFFKSDFTSAIKVTEVTGYTASDAVLKAASTISPLVEGYKYRNNFGTGVGQITYTVDEATGTSFNDFETAINTKAASSVIGTSGYALNVNMPQPGFYRIKNYEGNAYMVCGTSGQVKFQNIAGNGTNTIFYYDGTKLVSYENGLYFTNGGKNGETGNDFLHYNGTVSNGYNIQFTSDYRLDGKFFAKFPGGANNTTNCGRFLYCANVPNANGEATTNAGGTVTISTPDMHYRFILDPVQWLPVMKPADNNGYATIYSPVALNLKDKLTAYVAGNTNNGKVQMTSVDVVPANTGVLMKAEEGVEKDANNGYVYLEINNSNTTEVESALKGSVADVYVVPERDHKCYVLATPTDKETAFYKAKLNQQESTSFINNGFKAYLPVANSTMPGSRLMFDFGTETGIEDINGMENAAENAVIYDLSGRRVQGAQKGIYIINGKKVIK